MLALLEVTPRVIVAVYGACRGGSCVNQVTLTPWVSKRTRLSITLLTEARRIDAGYLSAFGVRTVIATCSFFAMRVEACVLFGAMFIARTRQCTGGGAGRGAW